ncbi:MAG: hypothetical protein CMH83_13115 [Nocardioides sp.]|nr:hypothetical protein [Nocardioides sp.]
MTTHPSWLPPAGPLTVDDLEALPVGPGDVRRYELLDGVLLVSPAPTPRHQVVVANLLLTLHASCPPDLRVLPAPLDVRLAPDTSLQPDLLVAPRHQFGDRDLPGAPLLAVEVLSPSTRSFDLFSKRDRWERAGCAAYWVIDPDDEGSLLAWHLEDGEFREVAPVRGHQTYSARRPFEVELTPIRLLD